MLDNRGLTFDSNKGANNNRKPTYVLLSFGLEEINTQM